MNMQLAELEGLIITLNECLVQNSKWTVMYRSVNVYIEEVKN